MSLRITLAVGAIALMAGNPAAAAVRTWIGNTDVNWNTGTNWSAALPVTADSLVFNAAGTAGTTLNNNLTASGFNVAGITFGSPAPAYTISGDPFTLSTGITNNSSALQTINGAITLNGANTFTAPGGGGIVLGEIRAPDGSSINLTSGTRLTLASLNGGATVNSKVNVTSAGDLTVAGGFQINNNVASAATFTQTGGTVTLNSAVDASATFGGGISLACRAGATTRNTYALQAGTLNAPNAIFYISTGGGANGLLNIAGGTANLRGIGLSGTSSSAVGAISLTGGRLNLGAGGLVRGATTAVGSTVTLGAGTVGAMADWASSSAMVLSDAATGVTFDTLDSVDNTTARTITLSGVLSGTGRLVKAGAGALVLSGANTYTGNTTISAGTLQIGDSGVLGNGNYAGNISNAGTFRVNTSANQTLSGVISGAGTLDKSGTGRLTLSGANTYTGTTDITGGTLALTGAGSLQSSSIIVRANSTFDVSGVTGGYTSGAGQTISGTGTIVGNVTVGGSLSPGNSPGVLTTSGGLTFASGSIFEWELDLSQSDPESNRGVAYDGVNTLSISGSGAVFLVKLTGTQDFSDTFWNQSRQWTDIFKTADGSSSLTNWASTFSSFQYSYNGQTVAPSTQGAFTLSGNSLSWSPVPEPGNALVGLLVAAGLLRRRR